MLTLKKLFYSEVQDICPNCGEACAKTDVLCPKCGKNLDELFEQLPDPKVTHELPGIVKALMNPQVIRAWNLSNAVILVASLLTPWIIFFSDVIAVKMRFDYVFGFQVLLFPVFTFISQQGVPLREFFSTISLSLLAAIAPAIAIYYSYYGIRTGLTMRMNVNTPTLRYIPAILRLLFALISLTLVGYGVGFNSYVSFGYILAIIGLSSAFILELIVPVLDSKHIKRKAA